MASNPPPDHGNSAHVAPSPTARHWRRVRFPSGGGPGVPYVSLEGRMVGFDDGARHPALLLLHPNPAHGGTMDNKILRAIADAVYPLGMGSLRYNSRGVGTSGGTIQVESGSAAHTWVHG